MFGFLRARRDQRAYRQAYARCCSFQHLYFGVESLVFLSYEAVFLYLCGADAGMHPGPPADTGTCCRLRASRRLSDAPDAEMARYCAALGLLLGRIKLDDDVRDERSWTARLARWRLAKRMVRAQAYFSTIDPDFARRVDGFIQQHLQLERAERPTDIREYAKPTGEAFAYVFGMFARRFSARPSYAEPLLSEMGRQIGTAIIVHDCAADWHRDRKTGQFNPLPSSDLIGPARSYAQQCLAQLGWLCSDEFGDGCPSSGVVRSTFDRLSCSGTSQIGDSQVGTSRTNPRPQRAAAHASARRPRLRRWSVRRRGDCDACGACAGGCEGGGCCEGCDCCGGGGLDAAGDTHHGACCDMAHACIVLPDCCCGDWGSNRKRQSSALGATAGKGDLAGKDDSALIGMVGRTTSDLKPTGVVLVGEKRLPARSDSGQWIDAQQPVLVTGQEKFGILVRPYSSTKTESP